MNNETKRQKFAKDLDKLMSGDYVLVPREPTDAMVKAGNVAMNPHRAQWVHPVTCTNRKKVYKAMIQAYEKEQGVNI
ncbi:MULTISPECIES: hypothetical protein [Acinetobacter]|uniref:Uncharacterized protein n=1 Tax=Acinetobacter baumannii TaxID=470 RepID=A0AAP1AD13_ACIBA|nr:MULTISPECIES: hypothetical protein [Acinetobacter]ETQ21596.1 hypothetical protein P647_1631 [Acinetobacter baumannii UH12208]ETQ38315.1 hypothetical protein P656_2455 [Acinetobacter baumannii UH16208]ETQ55515.1 hypothetical protein P658_0673 [Acinetobacter baumannii UH19608]ETQ57692.1 hypothetical protein P662_1169 [Acinetobacter baumannii UH22908]ETR06627.1 hypothetical protein P674_1047 [Acinetobacter baumannii UH6907]ETR13309.1 hypothetical protein P676_1074 [Acinetobacter baumannii UH7